MSRNKSVLNFVDKNVQKKAMIKYEKFHNLQRKKNQKENIFTHLGQEIIFAINDFDINSEQWIFFKTHIDNLDSNKTGRYMTQNQLNKINKHQKIQNSPIQF